MKKKRVSFNNIYYMKIDDRIGVVSDTHITSDYEGLEQLNDLYQLLYDNNIKQVFHCGDLCDGVNVWQDQMYEQKVVGADKQLDYIVKNYPKFKGMKTYYIAGNHDMSYFEKYGYDFCAELSMLRDDMIYLGPFYCKVRDTFKDVEIDLIHMRRGNAETISYPLQKYIRNLPSYKYPDILLAGHRHRNWYGIISGVHCFEAGNFQKVTPYALENYPPQPICGWILEYKKGKRSKLKIELIDYGYVDERIEAKLH